MPTPPIANVIFHAFHAAYLMIVPLGLLVLAVEAGSLRAFNREASLKMIVAYALAANLTSYAVGFWLAPSLFVSSGLIVENPDENGYGVLKLGPEWRTSARYSFLQAGVISAIVEILAILPIRRWAGLRRVVIPVVLGNVLSYVLLALIFLSLI